MELTFACMLSVAIVHCSLLTLNIWSTQYLRLSVIITDHTSFFVVDFIISADCATLIPHHSLKSSGAVLKFCSADKRAHGCLISVRFFGGYGTISMWMSFTSCSVTILATCRCCYLVEISIAIACFPDIQTLATSIWLKHCVLNTMSSSSAIWHSSSSTDWWNLTPILI